MDDAGKFRWQRLAATAVAGVVAGAGLIASSTPVQAAGRCNESRATARALAAAGDFWEHREQMEILHLAVRVSPSAGCAWGLISDLMPYAMSADVWVDRSRDGGVSWVKSAVRSVSTQGSTYTSAYSTQGYKAVRACGIYTRQTLASENNLVTGVSGLPETSDIYCTSWVTP